MKKIVFIFASMMIVEIQVIDAANSAPEEDSRRVERGLSTMKKQIGIIGLTLGIHKKEISSTYHKADNASRKADHTSQEVHNLKKTMRAIKKQQKEQDVRIARLENYIKLLTNEKDDASEKNDEGYRASDDDNSESDEPSPPPLSCMILNLVEPEDKKTNTFSSY